MQAPAALYSRSHILIVNNYPPLSFHANGLVGRIIGDYLAAGRLVALASLLSVAGLTGWIVFRLSRSATWSLVSSLLILLYSIYPFGQFFAVNNPQWLGQAIMLASIVPLIGSERGSCGLRACNFSAACVVIGLLTKQNQFALPLAIASWLYARDRQLFVTWWTAVIGFTAMACLTLDLIYGSQIFVEICGFSRTYTLKYFLKGLPKLACLIPFWVVGLIGLRQLPLDARWSLIAIYAGLGTVLSALQHLGAGVGENADYDALIGCTILACSLLGSGATRGCTRVFDRRRRAAALSLLLFPILITAPNPLAESLHDIRDINGMTARWSAMVTDVRNAPGPVLCEVLAVCFWAGKPMTLDFFAYGQKLRTGTDSAPLSAYVARKSAALIIRDRHFDQHSGEARLPQPLPRLIDENYKPVRSASTDIQELSPR